MEYSSDSENTDMTVVAGDDAYKPEEDDLPVQLTQAEPNDLTRDLNLSKESSQLLGSRFRETSVGTRNNFFPLVSRPRERERERERELRQFFVFQDKSSLVYCNNIAGLIKLMGLGYDCTEWRLFIDLSSRSLKVVLLYNGKCFALGIQYKWNSQQHESFAVCC